MDEADPFADQRLVSNASTLDVDEYPGRAAIFTGPTTCFVREERSQQLVIFAHDDSVTTAEVWLACGEATTSCGHELRCECAPKD